MSRPVSDQPHEFALAIANEIRKELGARRMSGRALARALDRSEKYVRDRLADKFEFSLNDVETFCVDVLQVKPEDFVARVDSPELTTSAPAANVTDLRDIATIHTEEVPFDDRLAAKRGTRKADQHPHAE